MRIAIIGAGFTGLSAAYTLTKQGHEVVLFEKDQYPGGLAIGYQETPWDWTLEQHYHHWFTNDDAILSLAKAIQHPVIIKRPKTSVYLHDKILQLDSPTALLQFSELSLPQRIRMGATLAMLRYNPFWQPLEKFRTQATLMKLMGKEGYELIWDTQLKNKFGEHAGTISLAWFWARIKKRTASLAYPAKGFLPFAQDVLKQCLTQGAQAHFETDVINIESSDKVHITYKTAKSHFKTHSFDKAIVTLPSFVFHKITPSLPQAYKNRYATLKGLGAINLVLRLKEPFLPDGTYWLSICEKNAPVMAIVEHTNFMDKKHYNNEHLVYVGNYLPSTHPYFQQTAEEILENYDALLSKLHPEYKKNLIGLKAFKAPYAQPIVPTNYSKHIPPMQSPLKNIYLANMQQVYPWDRGTNYAVALGEQVAAYASTTSM